MRAQWNVLLLDVWGNEVDGYEVNDQWDSGVTLELDDNAQTHEVLSLLCTEMGGNPDALSVDENMDTTDEMHVGDSETGRPECVLRRVVPAGWESANG
jgi:hypothetical protein